MFVERPRRMSGDLYAPGRTFSLTVFLWRPHTGYRAFDQPNLGKPEGSTAFLRYFEYSCGLAVDFNGRLLLTKHDTVIKTAEGYALVLDGVYGVEARSC